MTQITKNKAELWRDIQELANAPLNSAKASQLVDYMEVYDALCRVACSGEGDSILVVAEADAVPHLDRQMAEEWVSRMENADGTKGPHFSMDRTMEIMREHQVNCDPVEFFAALNSVYSDYCEALKENNTSNMKTYVCLAKAWLEDRDAVPNKAAAYYTYVVKH